MNKLSKFCIKATISCVGVFAAILYYHGVLAIFQEPTNSLSTSIAFTSLLTGVYLAIIGVGTHIYLKEVAEWNKLNSRG